MKLSIRKLRYFDLGKWKLIIVSKENLARAKISAALSFIEIGNCILMFFWR